MAKRACADTNLFLSRHRAPDQARAQRANVRGTALVEFTIATDGSVTDARILRGIPLVDEAALDCAREWRYEPVLCDGRPMPTRTTAAVSLP
jgi:protein TonB